jgi:hypothetical protein
VRHSLTEARYNSLTMLSTYGLPAPLLAKITNVHIDTARRWKRAGQIPSRYAPLVALHLDGELGVVDRQWQGWKLSRGTLWTPEHQPLRPGDVRAIPYQQQLIAELQRQLQTPRQFDFWP